MSAGDAVPYVRDGKPTRRAVREITEAVPPVRPRRPRGRSKSSPPDTYLIVYDDRIRDVALIRGRKVNIVVKMAGLADRATYSSPAKGWVIAGVDLPDLLAMADYSNTPYRIKAVAES